LSRPPPPAAIAWSSLCLFSTSMTSADMSSSGSRRLIELKHGTRERCEEMLRREDTRREEIIPTDD
jgi:hypothetical protein